MKLSVLLPPVYDERKWTLAQQIGVTHAITKATTSLSGKTPPYDFKSLKEIKDSFNEKGFLLHGLEGDQYDMSSIKLGLDDCEIWIEKYKQMLQNMGELEIPLLCVNFMASVGWYRTQINVPERGGALTSEFNHLDINEKIPVSQQISEKRLWDNLFHFLDAVVPIAEKNGVKIALHPDDPPISPFMGVGRILRTVEAFDKIIQKYNSPSLGITFCQATFKLMSDDLKTISERWLKMKKIFFIHLRDIEGEKHNFRETFHDNGPTDMAEMMKHYHIHGFDGPIRPDHAPNMFGEGQEDFSGSLSAGYEMLGKIFAIGYMKGIIDSF